MSLFIPHRQIALGLLVLSALDFGAFAQSATTDPVGFVTINVAAAANGDTQLSFKALGLTQPVDYQGSAETAANSGANAVLTDNDATWTDNKYNPSNATAQTATYYLEIVRPAGTASNVVIPGEGTTYDIIGTNATGKTVTLAGNLASGVAGTTTVAFKIRKYWTIGDVFGTANSAGLLGGAQGDADDVLIYNPSSGQFDDYYYRIGGIGGSSWRNANNGADATAQKIYPDDGLVIRRRATGTVSVTLSGAVKTGASSIPVVAGVNYLGNVYAGDMTLGSSGLYTGIDSTGVIGGAQGDADDVLIYDAGTKSYKTYYYRIGGIGGSSWRSSDDGSLATDVSIPAGTSVVIRRRAATGFNWVAPQHPGSI